MILNSCQPQSVRLQPPNAALSSPLFRGYPATGRGGGGGNDSKYHQIFFRNCCVGMFWAVRLREASFGALCISCVLVMVMELILATFLYSPACTSRTPIKQPQPLKPTHTNQTTTITNKTKIRLIHCWCTPALNSLGPNTYLQPTNSTPSPTPTTPNITFGNFYHSNQQHILQQRTHFCHLNTHQHHQNQTLLSSFTASSPPNQLTITTSRNNHPETHNLPDAHPPTKPKTAKKYIHTILREHPGVSQVHRQNVCGYFPCLSLE